MYTGELEEAANVAAARRSENIKYEPPRLAEEEKDALLREFHPDYIEGQFAELKIGPNKGERAPLELAEMLQAMPRVNPCALSLKAPDCEADVLIIGAGGAGTSAALEAAEAGASVLLVTKLRPGDANTMMAEGGIQAADKASDSPARHYLDAFGGGRFCAKPQLVHTLVTKAPEAILWLNELGVEFDKEKDGTMITTHGGGTSRKRMHACKDYSGAEIMRTLRDEAFNRAERIAVMEFTAAVELLKDESGAAAGAVLMNMETQELQVARAKVVILATGGAGRMHYQGFATSNHYGATADGLVLAYRAGAHLLYQDSLQYHPTGVAHPRQLLGQLVTEKARSLGAKLINRKGEACIHPLETRDVSASAIIRECKRGGGIKDGRAVGVWLDTPMIEMLHGEGAIERRLPAMLRMFARHGIDIRKEPVLVYPTLHYQNGGVEIDSRCRTSVPRLLAAGEVSGGVHGRNRLMGNSLLDVIVFGREAGMEAARLCGETKMPKELKCDHVKDFIGERKAAGISGDAVSPKLLPRYGRSRRQPEANS